MSGVEAVNIIADWLDEVETSAGVEWPFPTDALAAHVVSVLAASGLTIVSNAQVREMIGPSREVDSCPKCSETVTWEQNGYDLRENDDHRYSWVAYCEACKLDLELIPDPNPPIAAAAIAEEDK